MWCSLACCHKSSNIIADAAQTTTLTKGGRNNRRRSFEESHTKRGLKKKSSSPKHLKRPQVTKVYKSVHDVQQQTMYNEHTKPSLLTCTRFISRFSPCHCSFSIFCCSLADFSSASSAARREAAPRSDGAACHTIKQIQVALFAVHCATRNWAGKHDKRALGATRGVRRDAVTQMHCMYGQAEML